MKITDKARSIGATIAAVREERRRLRGPANLRYAIADSIAMLQPAHWDALAREASFFLGAKPEEYAVLCRHRQPILNKLMKGLLTGLDHEEPPQRSPSKQAA